VHQSIEVDEAVVQSIVPRHKARHHGWIDLAWVGRDQSDLQPRQGMQAQVLQNLPVRVACAQQHKLPRAGVLGGSVVGGRHGTYCSMSVRSSR
jgi:hypothetical protein